MLESYDCVDLFIPFLSLCLPGIDVGGLFKDFLTDLSARVFNPGFGLFSLTAQQQLYPHPSAAALLGHDPNHPHEMEDTFAFIGRVLGKGKKIEER